MTVSPVQQPDLALQVTQTVICKLRAARFYARTMDSPQIANMLYQARALIHRATAFPQLEWGEGTSLSRDSLEFFLDDEVDTLECLAGLLPGGGISDEDFRRALDGVAVTIDMFLNSSTLRPVLAAGAPPAKESPHA